MITLPTSVIKDDFVRIVESRPSCLTVRYCREKDTLRFNDNKKLVERISSLEMTKVKDDVETPLEVPASHAEKLFREVVVVQKEGFSMPTLIFQELFDELPHKHLTRSSRMEFLKQILHNYTEGEYANLILGLNEFDETFFKRVITFAFYYLVKEPRSLENEKKALFYLCVVKDCLNKERSVKRIDELVNLNQFFSRLTGIYAIEIFEEGLEELVVAAAKCPKIKNFQLKNVSFKSAKGMGKFLEETQSVTEVTFSSNKTKRRNKLTEENLGYLANGLGKNTSITKLILEFEDLDDTDLHSILVAIGDNSRSSISEVIVSTKMRTNYAARKAVDMMKKNKKFLVFFTNTQHLCSDVYEELEKCTKKNLVPLCKPCARQPFNPSFIGVKSMQELLLKTPSPSVEDVLKKLQMDADDEKGKEH